MSPTVVFPALNAQDLLLGQQMFMICSMNNDFDRQEWQAEQEAIDAALEKQREKDAKAKARAARNAQRKLDRLRSKLKEQGDLTDWEDEFSESVSERLEKFGSAFSDPEKGRRSDALSFSQKKVVAALNKKAKGETKRSGFKAKAKFTPRVRQIEDDMPDNELNNTHLSTDAPYIPEYTPKADTPKKPFLKVVK